MERTNLTTFLDVLRKRRLYVFSPLDLARLFGWSATSITFRLHRYSQNGAINRLKRGLYSLPNSSVPEFYVANRLHEPSYVSLESALSYHHIIPETAYGITSVTAKPTRTYQALGAEYSYHQVKRAAYAGYEPVDQGGFTVLLARPEKALADYCYLVTKGIRPPLDRGRLRTDRLDVNRLREYVVLFKNDHLKKLIASYVKI